MDNDNEFNNQSFWEFCNEIWVKNEFTNIYNPEQDILCDHANQSIMNSLCSISSQWDTEILV